VAPVTAPAPIVQYVQAPAQPPVMRYVLPPPQPPVVQYVQPPQQQVVQYLQQPPQYVVQPSQAAPQNTWPAPPPGYGYAPLAWQPPQGLTLQPPQSLAWQQPHNDVAGRDALYDELHETEMRLDATQGKSIRLGAPITFMILGYGTTLIFSAVALSSLAAAEDIENDRTLYGERDPYDYDNNGDGRVDAKDEESFRNTARATAAVAGVGLLTGLISTIRLVHKVGERKKLRRERASLIAKRTSLRRQLDYGVGGSPEHLTFNVNGRF
jgi:hypothetical protein